MYMYYRLLAALVCTGLSFMALWMSFQMPSLLWFAAWAAYIAIVFFWVRDNRAPRWLMVIGTLLGVTSVCMSLFMALFLASPAIGLMLHVLWCSFRPPAARVTSIIL